MDVRPAQFGRFWAGHIQGIAAAILYITLTGVNFGLQYPLLTVILESQGVSGAMIGASTMAQAVGAIAITPFMPAMLRRSGISRLLAAAALISIACLCLLKANPDPWFWMLVRPILGSAGSIAFYGAEYWIVALAPGAWRGRIIGVYTVCVASGFGVGPLILITTGFYGWLPFQIAMLVLLVSVIPVTLARKYAPFFAGEVKISEVPRFFLANPTICVAVCVFGSLESGFLGLVPAWGVRAGLIATAAVTLVAIAGFGNIGLQLFLGPASDRMNRRFLLGFCALACAACTLSLPALLETRWALWLAVFLLGGLAAGLYSISLVELGHRFEGRDLAVGNAAIILSYGIGAAAGPPFAGAMMDAIPPHGLMYALAAICLAFLALLVWRGSLRQRPGP